MYVWFLLRFANLIYTCLFKVSNHPLSEPIYLVLATCREDHDHLTMKDFFVVGILASDSDPEALQTFFKYSTHATDTCYVILRHPTNNQEFPAAFNGIPVYRVEEKTLLVPGRIFVTSSRHSYHIDQQQHLIASQAIPSTPFSTFFSSLAAQFRHKAVGIMLTAGMSNQDTKEMYAYGATLMACPAMEALLHKEFGKVQTSRIISFKGSPEAIAARLYTLTGGKTDNSGEAVSQRVAVDAATTDNATDLLGNHFHLSNDTLQVLNEQIKLVIASYKIGIWELNLASDTISWNDHAACMFDYKDKPFDHRLESVFRRIHPDDVERLRSAYQHTITHCNNFHIEYRIIQEDGTLVYAATQGMVLTDKQTKTVKIIGINSDNTNQHQYEDILLNARRQLQQSEERLEYAVQGTSDGIWDWINLESEKLWWSSGYYHLLGLEDQEVAATAANLIAMMHPDDRTAYTDIIHKRLEEEGTHEVELRISHKMLGYRWYLSRGKAFRDAEGIPIRLAGSLSDIHARKMVELQYAQTYEKLKRANVYLDDVVFTVAHDLSSPVANLKSLIALFKAKVDHEDPIIERIDLSVIKLEQTLQSLIQILDVHQTEHKSVTDVSFRVLMDSLMIEMKDAIKEAQADIQISLDIKQIAYIFPFIKSIVLNLLANAIKYVRPGIPASIRIQTEKHHDLVLLTVSDNGIGIDLERFENKIFKPFERLSNESTGQGIGLHLIKAIVEKNGGKVQVSSTLHEGTTFKVYLKPYADTSQERNFDD